MADGGAPPPPRAAVDSTAWAPLAHRAFRWLWLGVLVSNVGTWMQTVGAQWLLVDEPNAAALVALVPAAGMLPLMLLALPAGVLADSFDRRSLLLSVQGYVCCVATLLAVLTAADRMPPALVLGFTFALGASLAVLIPAWQAIIPELVPRSELRAAARLDAVSVNVARAVGPALAGVVIARAGVPYVFALNAASVLVLAAALLLWRRPPTAPASRERFVPALRAGGRYVRHEPVVRRILLRLALFVVPGMALWALLPVVATDRLGLGAAGYGALFAALGGGAVLGAFVVAPATARLSTNGMLAAAGALYAAALAIMAVTTAFPVALATLVVAGLAWMATLSTLNAELQLFLPGWVRARGLAVLMVMFGGSQVTGALVWGAVGEAAGLEPALLVAAGLLLLGTLIAALTRPVGELGHLDRRPAIYWGEARLAFDPEPDAGPVVVAVEYTVSRDNEPEFLEATNALRSSRLRSGATRWELYRDGLRPDRFVELFSVPSWEEHLRQHEGRLTAADQEIEATVAALSDPPPRADHLLPP